MRDELLQVAGVNPSESWLNDCLRAIDSSNNNRESFVLEQILHHDLRAVVQPLNNNGPSTCSQQLRQATAQRQPKVELPANFRLMVQVEAFANMAVGMEKRLESNNSGSNRCLKLAFTDGYDDDTTFTAMEISPLADMPLLAGVKVLLKGPLTIRHGIVGWTPANAIVLGGCVDALVEQQKLAMQKAKQRAGHGVDPTIKALIWNNQNLEQEQEGT